MNYWRKIYQSIVVHEVWTDPLTLKVFLWCLLHARTAPEVRPDGICLKTGDWLFTLRQASAECQIPRTTFHRVLARLNELDVIRIRGDKRYTIVTVLNYAKWQGNGGTKLGQLKDNGDKEIQPQEFEQWDNMKPKGGNLVGHPKTEKVGQAKTKKVGRTLSPQLFDTQETYDDSTQKSGTTENAKVGTSKIDQVGTNLGQTRLEEGPEKEANTAEIPTTNGPVRQVIGESGLESVQNGLREECKNVNTPFIPQGGKLEADAQPAEPSKVEKPKRRTAAQIAALPECRKISIDLPPQLDNPRFRSVFGEFVLYRLEESPRGLTAKAQTGVIEELERAGLADSTEKAAETLEYTMKRGWQFPYETAEGVKFADLKQQRQRQAGKHSLSATQAQGATRRAPRVAGDPLGNLDFVARRLEELTTGKD